MKLKYSMKDNSEKIEKSWSKSTKGPIVILTFEREVESRNFAGVSSQDMF